MTLFLGYATQHLGKPPVAMQLVDITPELILKFLAHLKRERHDSVRSRNLRLTALRTMCACTAATQAMQRVGNYWHMLPEYAQARKSVWEAVNPRTGSARPP